MIVGLCGESLDVGVSACGERVGYECVCGSGVRVWAWVECGCWCGCGVELSVACRVVK